MKVLIIRHAESLKNINRTFATEMNSEPLTNRGIQESQLLACELQKYIVSRGLICRNVYSANSVRARTTGQIIAEKLDANLVAVNEFLSLKNNSELIGLSEIEVELRDSVFINELSLSRTGIFNAYNHTSNLNVDRIKKHESKVYSKYKEIISDECEEIKIIIMHHSSLTATMINIARDYYGYPKEFFGNIEAELGHLYLINYTSTKVKIELANVNPKLLSK